MVKKKSCRFPIVFPGIVSALLLLAACTTPEPTACAISPSIQTPERPFSRTNAWFTAFGDEYPSAEQMEQLVDAVSADVVAYLEKAITPTLSLENQRATLAQMAADLPSHSRENGQVISVDLDEAAQAELFIAPKLNGGPLLYARYADGNWQSLPVPAAPPGSNSLVDNSVNLWPVSAETRDMTGDGRPEALVTHAFSGGSNWREHVQVLHWNDDSFDVLFRAELVNWAGRSTWELEPNSDGGQDVVLRYPYFYSTGFESKMVAHPQATQRWRWDSSLTRYVLQETQLDLESVLGQWAGEPEWELLRVLVNEAELDYQAGDLEEALEGYRDVVARAAAMERPKQKSPHWPAYARFRITQIQAMLGQVDAAQGEMNSLLADLDKKSNLRPLIQAFDDAYDPTQADAALRAIAALHRLRMYKPGYVDRPGNLTFPMDMGTLLWPGTPLARYLDAHPEAVDGSPSPEREQALLRALSELGFPVTDVRIADIDAAGHPEALVTTDETDQPNGRRSVWLLAHVEDGWRSCRQPNKGRSLGETLTEEPLPDGRIALRKDESVFVWTGNGLVEVDPDTLEPLPPDWPIVGSW
jgi:hypothetical protein